jgi:SpoVK/Ycf46/Vps4 family AAA+-type ATPase
MFARRSRSRKQEAKPKDKVDLSTWGRVGDDLFSPTVPPFGPELPNGTFRLKEIMGRVFFHRQTSREEPLLRFDGLVDQILKEIDAFWEKQHVFETLGLPFRRGILLHGPPGTGKTSLCRLVLNDIADRGGVGILSDDVRQLSRALEGLRQVQPDVPVVVVIEDLDSALQFETTFLDILDGHAEGFQKIVFIATTNNLHRLPDRIKNRPSRFDRKFLVGMPSPETRRVFLEDLSRRVPAELGLPELDLPKAVDLTNGLSIAHVKEVFLSAVVLGIPMEESVDAARGVQ